VWGATAGMVMPKPRTFDKGLVFVKDTDILLSGDKWIIVVNIALDDYDALVHMMKTTLNQVRQKIQVHKNPRVMVYSFDIHWDEIDRLDTMVQELDDDLQSFRKLLFEEVVFRSPTNVSCPHKKRINKFVRVRYEIFIWYR